MKRMGTLFWVATVVYAVLFAAADYRLSYLDEMPADGPLTIGFPFTAYIRGCGMIGGGCSSDLRLWAIAVDFVFCAGLALAAAYATQRMRHKKAGTK